LHPQIFGIILIINSIKIANVAEVPFEEVFYLAEDTHKAYNYKEPKFPIEFYLDL